MASRISLDYLNSAVNTAENPSTFGYHHGQYFFNIYLSYAN